MSTQTITLEREHEALAEQLKGLFPQAAARDDQVAETPGGRRAGLAKMHAVEPGRYGKTRNHIHGAVTRLSPYLRHGALSLAEVRDHVLETSSAKAGYKLIQELAWRDYWQRVYAEIGDLVWEDQEAPKTGLDPEDYDDQLPEELPAGETGLACMDGFAKELAQTGYLHNHARMWVAAYVIHYLRVKWQAGAAWFLTHLLDGDPASNNLSWQWVGSYFAHKPYIFNKWNIEKYTDGLYCKTCPRRSDCPFDESYEALNDRLFPGGSRDA